MGQPKRKEPLSTAPSPIPVPASPPEPRLGLSPRGWLVLLGALLLANLPLIHRFFLRGPQAAPISIPYQDDFSDPGTVEKHYWTTGGYWRVVNGQLLSPGVKNNPLWLKAKLPTHVAVDFDVRSNSPEGDIKFEIFGDGLDHASGYVLIHGGWSNSLSIIARLDEHGASLGQLEAKSRALAQARHLPKSDLLSTGTYRPDTRMRIEANPYPVQPGRTYHWHIERKRTDRGEELLWSIDGQPFMSFLDPYPLEGVGHDRFGFSSWESDLYFDNLKIEPL